MSIFVSIYKFSVKKCHRLEPKHSQRLGTILCDITVETLLGRISPRLFEGHLKVLFRKRRPSPKPKCYEQDKKIDTLSKIHYSRSFGIVPLPFLTRGGVGPEGLGHFSWSGFQMSRQSPKKNYKLRHRSKNAPRPWHI